MSAPSVCDCPCAEWLLAVIEEKDMRIAELLRELEEANEWAQAMKDGDE